MTLKEAVRDIRYLDQNNTIFAAEPWSENSEAVVVPEPSAPASAAEIQRLRLKYFLEVLVARDFLDGWVSNLKSEPTLDQKCARLIQYAITDA